jgi:hypothetical protein
MMAENSDSFETVAEAQENPSHNGLFVCTGNLFNWESLNFPEAINPSLIIRNLTSNKFAYKFNENIFLLYLLVLIYNK